MVRNKAVHIALGVWADGAKEILGLWLEQNEGAKFRLRVMNELRNRGVEDIRDCQDFRVQAAIENLEVPDGTTQGSPHS